jgi:DNA-3-methyladenine glycosylase
VILDEAVDGGLKATEVVAALATVLWHFWGTCSPNLELRAYHISRSAGGMKPNRRSRGRGKANAMRYATVRARSIPFDLTIQLPPPLKRGVDYGFLPGSNFSKSARAPPQWITALGFSRMLEAMAKRTSLEKSFFERDTLMVARELLGKFLVREGMEESALMVTEVEAYDGPADLASHAARGKTPRNSVMFGDAGVWYIYLCYGVYWLANIVTGPPDYPAAILIRGVEGVSGPGRLTRHLGIGPSLNGRRAEKGSGLWLEERGVMINPRAISKTPRIGVSYAGPIWANKEYRFVLRSLQKIRPGTA